MATASDEALQNSCVTINSELDGKRSQLEVPRDVLEHAQIFVLDKDRTPATMTALISSLKLYVCKRYPDSINKTSWIRECAATAFVDVEEESATWQLIERRRSQYEVHFLSRKWLFQTLNRFASVFAVAVAAGSVGAGYFYPKHRGLTSVCAASLLSYHFGLYSFLHQCGSRFIDSHYRLSRLFKTQLIDIPDDSGDLLLLNEWWPRTGMHNRLFGGQPSVKVSHCGKTLPAVCVPVMDALCVEVNGGLDKPSDVNYFTPEPLTVVEAQEYDRSVFNIVNQVIGTDQCHTVPENGFYSKPSFIGERDDVVFYTKLETEKKFKDNDSVKPLFNDNCDKIGNIYHIGPGWLDVLPAAFANTSLNEEASLCGRHLSIKHSDDVGLWTEVIVDTIPYFIESVHSAKQMSLDEWLLTQPMSKRQNYKDFNSNLVGLNMDERKVHFRNFFIKDEVLIPPYQGDIRQKYPRGIQGLQHSPTNMVLGPFMTMVSKALAAQFGGIISYSSGRLPHEIGAWYHDCKEKGFSFYEDDFSQFDSTQGAGCHKAEVAFYKLFNPDSNVSMALEMQTETTGFGRFFKYKTKYTRKSGDQNTSIGNSVINAMAHLWANGRYNKIRGHNVEVKLLVLGDDNLLAVKGEGLDYCSFMQQQIELLGLKPKFIRCGTCPTYCSSVFLPVRDASSNLTHVLVPELCRRMAKMGWTVTKPNCKSYLRMKGNCQSFLNNQLMPVGRIFDDYYLSQRGDASLQYDYRVHGEHVGEYYICDATLQWFEVNYGLTVPEIMQLEAYLGECLNKSGNLPFLWQHVLASKMYDHFSRRS